MNKLDIHTLNPYIRVAIRSVLKRGCIIKQRIIFDYELIYVEDGGMTFFYDGIPYPCQKGDFILIRPGISHSFHCREQMLSQPHIHFDMIYTANSRKTPISFKDLGQMSPMEKSLIQKDLFSNFPKTPFIRFSNTENALTLFYKIIDQFSSNQKLAAKGNLTTLLSHLINDNFAGCMSENEEAYGIAQQLKDFIDSTNGVNINLDALEKQFSYSKFHLEREFKKKYERSLIAYTNERRMELARKLLESQTVGEVAKELGFSSIYAFSRAFKNHCGISPTIYKKR